MKKQLNTIAFSIIVFAFVLISLSCDGAPQNNTPNNNTPNINTNQNETAENKTPDSEVATASDKCDGPVSNRISQITAEMDKEIRSDTDLRVQYAAQNFAFKPVAGTNDDVQLYIWGLIYTDKNKINKLNKTFAKFVKSGCISKVNFKKAPGAQITIPDGFEFGLCESPNVICSDGTCRNVCLMKTDATNTNSNTETNSNANTNTNSNSES